MSLPPPYDALFLMALAMLVLYAIGRALSYHEYRQRKRRMAPPFGTRCAIAGCDNVGSPRMSAKHPLFCCDRCWEEIEAAMAAYGVEK